MYLTGKYSNKAIKENSTGKNEYQRRDVKVNLPYYRLSISKIAFNTTLLNARS